MLYVVRQIANRENCLCEGYSQGFEAYILNDDGIISSFCGGSYGEGFDDPCVIVQEKLINADSPHKAIGKFKDWLFNGLSDTTLIINPQERALK